MVKAWDGRLSSFTLLPLTSPSHLSLLPSSLISSFPPPFRRRIREVEEEEMNWRLASFLCCWRAVSADPCFAESPPLNIAPDGTSSRHFNTQTHTQTHTNTHTPANSSQRMISVRVLSESWGKVTCSVPSRWTCDPQVSRWWDIMTLSSSSAALTFVTMRLWEIFFTASWNTHSLSSSILCLFSLKLLLVLCQLFLLQFLGFPFLGLGDLGHLQLLSRLPVGTEETASNTACTHRHNTPCCQEKVLSTPFWLLEEQAEVWWTRLSLRARRSPPHLSPEKKDKERCWDADFCWHLVPDKKKLYLDFCPAS